MMLIRAALCSTLGCSIYIGTMARIRGTLDMDTAAVISISVTQNIIMTLAGECWLLLEPGGRRGDKRNKLVPRNFYHTEILSFFSPTFLAIQIFTS